MAKRQTIQLNDKIFGNMTLDIEHSGEVAIRLQSDEDGTFKLIGKSEGIFTVDKLVITIPCKYDASDKIYVNGYQSWTDSFEYSLHQKMYEPAFLMRLFLKTGLSKKVGIGTSGDRHILDKASKKGEFYGFSYGYIRKGDNIKIIGSLSERQGYTIITFDTNNDKILIAMDLDGKVFCKGESVLTYIGMFEGEYDKAFDDYFAKMGIAKRDIGTMNGYTTWYNYYGNISQDIVLRDLKALSSLDAKVDIFQIDDGYQQAIGDWLECKQDKFALGMKAMADSIHSSGMKAGLWLAPFAVTAQSKVYKNHKDWLVKDDKGRPVKAGLNWGGFYSLDIYNNQAREYIRHFFDVILNHWGYDMVKLDFLYCACMRSMYGKSKGEIMCDAMDFLRECCKDKLILGCGVPMMPAFGKVDYCRIGPDLSLDWGKNNYDHREGVSTRHTLLNSVFRRHLDGRAFGNDPDVFLLRDNNIKMSIEQRRIVANINKICGRVLFTSDNVGDYDKHKMDILKGVFQKCRYQITRADYDGKVLTIEYREQGKEQNCKYSVDMQKGIEY